MGEVICGGSDLRLCERPCAFFCPNLIQLQHRKHECPVVESMPQRTPVLSTASKRANALIWSSNIFNLANNAGTSVEQIERFYARNLPLSAEMAKNVQAFGDQ